jgi:hypothetical protein
LVVEVDALRVSLGQWQEHDESKLAARALALALADAHLRSQRDVVVPQFLGRVAFIEQLHALAVAAGATFVEVVVTADEATVIDRFRTRQAELARTGEPHPQADVDSHDVSRTIAEALDRLDTITTSRPHTHVIDAGDYNALMEAVASDAARVRRRPSPSAPARDATT